MLDNLAHAVLCRDVLSTVNDVLWSLPSMSLSDESKIPPLGKSSLHEVSKFLRQVVMQTDSGADIESNQ